MTQYLRRCGCRMFFERAPDRAVAGAIDDAEFYNLGLQQPQAPARVSLGRLGTGKSDQPRFLLAVENRRYRRHGSLLAAQNSLKAFLHQLLAHPVNHRNTGPQSRDDTAVAPRFALLRDIGFQQDARLQQPLRRALPLAQHRFKPLALVPAQQHNIALHRRLSRRHNSLHRWYRDGEGIIKSFQID